MQYPLRNSDPLQSNTVMLAMLVEKNGYRTVRDGKEYIVYRISRDEFDAWTGELEGTTLSKDTFELRVAVSDG